MSARSRALDSFRVATTYTRLYTNDDEEQLRTMPSTGGRRRRHGGHDAHLLIILCIFAAVFGVAMAGGGSPSLDPDPNGKDI